MSDKQKYIQEDEEILSNLDFIMNLDLIKNEEQWGAAENIEKVEAETAESQDEETAQENSDETP